LSNLEGKNMTNEQNDHQVVKLAISADDWKAFERFRETVDSASGCDVPDAMMSRLAEIGLVCGRQDGNGWVWTEFGLAMLEATSEPTGEVVTGQIVTLCAEAEA
jgi:hypothetical protein